MANIANDPKPVSNLNRRLLSVVCLIELVCSGLALLILSPILIAIGIAVKVTSPGPVFISVPQFSEGGETSIRHRFRTTCLGEGKTTGSTDQHNESITVPGRFLSATGLDKLPRLLDVFLQNKHLARSMAGFRSKNDCLAMLSLVRNRHFFLLDCLALLLIPTVTMTLLTDGLSWWSAAKTAVFVYTVSALMIHLTVFYKMGLYNRYWKYAGISELTQVVLAVGVATVIVMTLYAIIPDSMIAPDLVAHPWLTLITGILALAAVSGSRFGLAGTYRWLRLTAAVNVRKRLLIAGAGEAGKIAAHEIGVNPLLNMDAVAFADDDLRKVGTRIEGLPVVGTLDMIPQLVKDLKLHEVIVAIPSAPLGRQQEIMNLCKENEIDVSSLPGLFEILAGYKTISPIPQINLDSLLDRQPVETDQSDIARMLHGANVLVTGAGGSIGSELCRQVARLEPAEMVLLGHGENSIFEIGLSLSLAFPELTFHPTIVDVRDEQGVDWTIRRYRPDIIFHAAAHKHVPFMEECVGEAITNNVQGTSNVLQAAQRHNVPRLVLISSDKAVNPTSIMGASKRIAEILVKVAAEESGQAYMAVRFGNVLGSRGSVIPVFQWQIQAGGPVKVTHPEMRRYFMTIPEAVQLVLQAAILGEGGEIFTLDMGKQIRILDLAQNLIKRSGLTVGRDIDIVFSGIRPGEKLEEELFLKNESYIRKQQRLFVEVNDGTVDGVMFKKAVSRLICQAKKRQDDDLVEQIQAIIPEYRPQAQVPVPKVGTAVPQPSSLPLEAGSRGKRVSA